MPPAPSDPPSPPGQAIPRHVAIVMDGNGRWAKRRRLPRPMGHREGVKAVRRVVQACQDQGVEVLTLFAFSSENWRRPRIEVSLLLNLFLTTLRSEIKRLHGSGIRIRFIGDRAPFPLRLREVVAEAEELTGGNDDLTLVIAANYGGRWDIAHAARRLARDVLAGTLEVDEITPERLAEHLALSDLPEPDLFIRSGGEQRISNFLLWQMAYTEFFFTDRLWPDFDAGALAEAFASFGTRQRRFGRTGDQVEDGHHA